MRELVSIIVPVFNGEKTLRRCVDSLLTQTYSPIEILLIDDGSEDLSPQICEEYALKDERVRVFHLPNNRNHNKHEDFYKAKNFGLDNVSGSWITFCRQDDYVGKTYIFSFFYRKILHRDCLYVTGKREGFLPKATKQVRHIHFSSPITEEVLDKMQNNPSVWGKLFNRKNINKIHLRFNETSFTSDDKIFTMRYLKEVKEVAYNKKYFPYFHILTFNSANLLRSFAESWANYKTVSEGLKTQWPEMYKTLWVIKEFKILVYSVLYENVSKSQKIKNLQKIRDDKDTKLILEEIVKQKHGMQFLWRNFFKRNYSCVIAFGSPVIKCLCTLSSSKRYNWLKKRIKNIVE